MSGSSEIYGYLQQEHTSTHTVNSVYHLSEDQTQEDCLVNRWPTASPVLQAEEEWSVSEC